MNTFETLTSGNGHVVVVGLGYVGLPLAVALANKVPVIGFDSSEAKVQLLQSGVDPTEEVGDVALKASSLRITSDESAIGEGDFVIVAVPTPVKGDHTPDLEPVLQASHSIGRHLKPGAIVVYESTVYPGVSFAS